MDNNIRNRIPERGIRMDSFSKQILDAHWPKKVSKKKKGRKNSGTDKKTDANVVGFVLKINKIKEKNRPRFFSPVSLSFNILF